MPADAVKIYSPANVIDGVFTYTGSARKDRHSVVQVTWNDPNDKYRQRIEYVDDHDLIQKYGIRKAEIVAFGCSSRGQAHRAGRWLLYTEMYEGNMIQFKVGLDSATVLPGQIVKIHDPYTRTGRRLGGRSMGFSPDLKTITLDAPVEIQQVGAQISIVMSDGALINRTVTNGVGTHSTLSWVTALPSEPVKQCMWILAEPSLQPITARVVGVAQDGAGLFNMTVVEHNPSKYAAIEDGMNLEAPITSGINPHVVNQPTSLHIYQTSYLMADKTLGVKLGIFWSGNGVQYRVSYRVSGGNWVSTTVRSPNYDIEGVATGSTYEIEIHAIGAFDAISTPLTGSHTVLVDTTPPGQPTGLTATGGFNLIDLTWTNPSDLDLDHIEVWENSVDNVATAAKIADVAAGNKFTRTRLKGLVTKFFWVRAVDTAANVGDWNSSAGTSGTTSQATHEDMAEQMLTESLLAPQLLTKINNVNDNATQIADYYDDATILQSTVNGVNTRLVAVESDLQSGGGANPYIRSTDVVGIVNQAASAAVSQVNAAYLGVNGAIAQSTSSLRTEVDGKFADLTIDAQTVNGLLSQYVVKIDNNGYVSGFGLASGLTDPVTGKITSEFVINADRFMIVQANGVDAPVSPFIVNENGKVSMNHALIDYIESAKLRSPDGKFVIDLENKFISIEV
jgi:predicted phage tail protein